MTGFAGVHISANLYLSPACRRKHRPNKADLCVNFQAPFINKRSTVQKNTEQGAAIYSRLVLKLYDWWVLGISNRLAWKCATKQVLLPFFKQYIGQRHLEVGVGTGYYLHNASLPPSQHITLMDLNPNSLDAASARLNRSSTQLYTARCHDRAACTARRCF